MNAGQCVIHAFLFSAPSPLGLSVSHGLGSEEDVAFMSRSKRICVCYPSQHTFQFCPGIRGQWQLIIPMMLRIQVMHW